MEWLIMVLDKNILLVIAAVAFGINAIMMVRVLMLSGIDDQIILRTLKKFPRMKPIGLTGLAAVIIYGYLYLAQR